MNRCKNVALVYLGAFLVLDAILLHDFFSNGFVLNVYRSWCCLWYCQVWCWTFRYGCLASWFSFWSVLSLSSWLVFWVFMVSSYLCFYLVVVSVIILGCFKIWFSAFLVSWFPISLTLLSSYVVAMKQTLFSGFIQMAAGLSVGLSCLAGKLEWFAHDILVA